MQLHTVICEGGKLHRVDMSLFEKKAARTFGDDEGMALRERVDVQERKAGNSRPVSSTRSHLLRKLTKIPSREACNMGSPLCSSNNNSIAIELRIVGARIRSP